MLIDPSKHHGPALWQGIMLIAVSLWAMYILSDTAHKYPKSVKWATSGLAVFGVVLFVLITRLGG